MLEDNSGVKRRRRAASLSDSEIMTILLYFHFGTFRNFKHYYLFFIKGTMKSYFPKAVSYNRFVELESRVFFQLMFFLNLGAFGRCTGITFVDSTMISVCHNLRRYANKVSHATNRYFIPNWGRNLFVDGLLKLAVVRNSICKIYVCIIIVRFLCLRKFVVRHALINHHAVEWYHIIMLNGGIAQFLQGVHIDLI